MGGSGVRRASSALFGFEQTVGIDLSLERRREGRPGGFGRLARVVGRVKSVCTDPPAKGPTGPFCFVHLLVPVVLRRHLPRSWPDRIKFAFLPCWVSRALVQSPSLCFGPRSTVLLSRAWGRVQEAERERSDLTLTAPAPQGIVYGIVLCLTVRVLAAISCTKRVASQAERE